MSNIKYVLKQKIKDKLLGSHEVIGWIADHSFDSKGKKLEYQTIRSRIINNSPLMTTVESIGLIKEVLSLSASTMVYESITVGSPELHHE